MSIRWQGALLGLLVAARCTPVVDQEPVTYHYHPDSSFNTHWYDGLAEVNRYALTQQRYGEQRQGDAIVIFVTETHDAQSHVKVNDPSTGDLPVLKMNHYRRFPTGIYPYTLMTGVFTPVDTAWAAYPTRISHSMQEWCGQVFLQVDRWQPEQWHYRLHSYFEDESRDTQLEVALTEDGLWNLLRLDPAQFPTGRVQLVPAAHYLRFTHQPWSPHQATATIYKGVAWPTDTSSTLTAYQIAYPTLDRTIRWYVSPAFPYTIVGWEAHQADQLYSRGLLTAQKRLPYWQMNTVADSSWADSLGVITH